jgi:hypothetical protein
MKKHLENIDSPTRDKVTFDYFKIQSTPPDGFLSPADKIVNQIPTPLLPFLSIASRI